MATVTIQSRWSETALWTGEAASLRDAVAEGDTPETSQFSRLAAEWVEEWLVRMRAAFGAPA